jgi:hypothetical protein
MKMISRCFGLILALFMLTNLIGISCGTVDLKQYDLDSETKDLIWCGAGRDVVLILTETNSLYKSEDKGFTWKKLNDIISSTGKEQLEENENEVFQYLIISNIDRKGFSDASIACR